MGLYFALIDCLFEVLFIWPIGPIVWNTGLYYSKSQVNHFLPGIQTPGAMQWIVATSQF
jgi:hypothetical protein